MEETITYNCGGIWEKKDWKLVKNYQMEEYDKSCPHTESGIIPYVIVATNEGGFNTTGLCASCVIGELIKVGII